MFRTLGIKAQFGESTSFLPLCYTIWESVGGHQVWWPVPYPLGHPALHPFLFKMEPCTAPDRLAEGDLGHLILLIAEIIGVYYHAWWISLWGSNLQLCFSFLLFFVLFFRDRVSLCPSCPGTHVCHHCPDKPTALYMLDHRATASGIIVKPPV